MVKFLTVFLAALTLGAPSYAKQTINGKDSKHSRSIDFDVFKTITLPSFPNMQIPVYKSSGTEGPAVLLVHGNSSSSRSFLLQKFGSFGQDRKVFLLDLPGYGRASKVDPALPFPVDANGTPVGFPEYQAGLVEAVATVANDPEVQAEVLVGWSLGGDVILLAQGLGILPNTKGIFMFGTSPAGANPGTTETPFLSPDVPGLPGLSILASFGLGFQTNANSPLGFDLNATFFDPVPSYAPAPISDANNTGDAYVRAFFKARRRARGKYPKFFRQDAFRRADPRARGSLGVVALGLLPPGPVAFPDELDVLRGLAGDPNDPSDDIPIGVLHGDEDAFVNLQYLEALKNNGTLPTLWKNKIIVVKKAGHAVHYERAHRFNRILGRFIDSL